MIKRSKGGFVITMVGWLALGCSSGAGGENLEGAGGAGIGASGDLAGPTPDALAAFGGVRTCEYSGAECYDLYADAQDQCWIDAIDFPQYKCTGVLSDTWPLGCVGGNDDECLVYSYRFRGGESVPEVKATCEAAMAHLEACGQSVNASCDNFSRAERPEVADAYQCYANTQCGESTTECSIPSPIALGTEICARLDQACETVVCSRDWETAMNANGGWWKEATIAAARACAQEPYCRNIKSCLQAWSRAVSGESGIYPFDHQTLY